MKKKAILPVKIRRVRDQTDVSCRQGVLFDVGHNRFHDSFAQSLALVLRQNSYIDDMIKTTPVADNSTHPDHLFPKQDRYPKQRIWQPANGRLITYQAQARCLANTHIRFRLWEKFNQLILIHDQYQATLTSLTGKHQTQIFLCR